MDTYRTLPAWELKTNRNWFQNVIPIIARYHQCCVISLAGFVMSCRDSPTSVFISGDPNAKYHSQKMRKLLVSNNLITICNMNRLNERYLETSLKHQLWFYILDLKWSFLPPQKAHFTTTRSFLKHLWRKK